MDEQTKERSGRDREGLGLGGLLDGRFFTSLHLSLFTALVLPFFLFFKDIPPWAFFPFTHELHGSKDFLLSFVVSPKLPISNSSDGGMG